MAEDIEAIGRWEARKGSQTGHCCFVATVVDTTKPERFEDHCEQICECFSFEQAELIAAALNASEHHLTKDTPDGLR